VLSCYELPGEGGGYYQTMILVSSADASRSTDQALYPDKANCMVGGLQMGTLNIRSHCVHAIETNMIHLVLFGMQKDLRTYLKANDRILISVMCEAQHCPSLDAS
jgi:hypothetical protein